MADERLVSYIKFSLQRGISAEQLKQILIPRGWNEQDINEAINLARGGMPSASGAAKQAPLVNNQLVEYLKTCMRIGGTIEQIKQKLASAGWSAEEIDAAIKSVQGQVPLTTREEEKIAREPEEKKGPRAIFIILIIGGIFIFLALVGVLGYYVLSGDESEDGLEVVECEKDSDCDSGYECKDKECVKESKPGPSGTPVATPSPTSSGSSGGSSGGSGSSGGNGDVKIKDCGNIECFIAASESCELSKFRHSYETDVLGEIRTNTMYYELKGMESDKCVFYLKTESIDVEYTEALRQDMIDSGISEETVDSNEQVANIKADESEGKEGTCKVKPDDLTSILGDWEADSLQVGIFPDDVWVYAECSGSYFS